MSIDDEVVKEFLVESHENLDQLDRDFVALEADPGARDRIAAIFRTIHTIKGTSGFLGLPRLQTLTHAGESLLTLLRDGTLSLTPEITSALLAMVDVVRRILANVEATGGEGAEEIDDVVAQLSRLQKRPTSKPDAATGSAAAPTALPVGPPNPGPRSAPAGAATGSGPQPSSTQAAPGEVPGFASAAPPGAAPSLSIPAAVSDPPSHLFVEPLIAPQIPAQSTRQQHDPPAGSSVAESSIRVDVGLLDRLMNLVGELVLARNQVLQFSAASKDPAVLGTSQRLDLITTELQEGVMKTRMQPIGNVWNKFPRLVRDLAVACNKKVSLQMEGAGTELDRTIIDAIKDPLTHLVRNSVDHGIERPSDRVAHGKPEGGTIIMRAFHEGGKVNIELSDDGQGIDRKQILARAVKRGMISSDRAARMSEREALNIIFLPGFSTAEKVSNVSGRGVGMDVVKTNIERIGGTVDVSTKPGHGTSIKIKIPLTLAIIPALIVTTGGERYAIPQVNLLELVRLEGDHARAGVESIQGAPVYRLRGNLLPLVYLNQVLGYASDHGASDIVNIIVLQADDRQFGLVVDGVNDTEEIVVKPLGKELKAISAFAGATIMGDGRVALILDVLGVAQRSGVISETRERTLRETLTQDDVRNAGREALLLFQVSEGGRVALPLSKVARLEEFPRAMLERAGKRDVVQYRGEILPLVVLREMLCDDDTVPDASAPLQVVVYSERGRSIGLVVDRILDIVEDDVSVKAAGSREGILGAAVIQGKVTDMLDVHAVIRRFDPQWLPQDTAA
ncbi:MAG: chemotaxis protein CheW [Polyangiaceae bacterium]|jgi:two-component system chemotaxis sensor kinase CheA